MKDSAVFLAEQGVSSANTLYWVMTVVALVVTLPFVVVNFIQGSYLTTLAGLLILVTLSTVCYRMLKFGRHSEAVLLYGLLPAMVIAIVSAIHDHGVIGALWAYPAIATFFVLFDLKHALIASVAIYCMTVPFMISWLSLAVALRLTVTVAVVLVCFAVCSYGAQKRQSSLYDLAMRDPLTGFLNRTSMQHELMSAMKTARMLSHPVSLAILDLDNFKKINDEWGHQAGDQVLVRLSKLVNLKFRESDLKFRIGGEEFMLLLPTMSETKALQVMQGLLHTLEAAVLHDQALVTASVGVAELRTVDRVEDWVGRADAALYQAKAQGKNCVVMAEAGPLTNQASGYAS